MMWVAVGVRSCSRCTAVAVEKGILRRAPQFARYDAFRGALHVYRGESGGTGRHHERGAGRPHTEPHFYVRTAKIWKSENEAQVDHEARPHRRNVCVHALANASSRSEYEGEARPPPKGSITSAQ
eukprot:IDg14788t1